MVEKEIKPKASEFLLDAAIEKYKYKIKSVKTSAVLPIVWFGEKTEPFLYGYGRLIKIVFEDGSAGYYVERLLEYKHAEDIRLPLEAIVIGGVKPTLFKIENVAKIVKSEQRLRCLDMDILEPSGIGYKSWALIGKRIDEDKHLNEVEAFAGELYDPPHVYWFEYDRQANRVKCKLLNPPTPTDC